MDRWSCYQWDAAEYNSQTGSIWSTGNFSRFACLVHFKICWFSVSNAPGACSSILLRIWVWVFIEKWKTRIKKKGKQNNLYNYSVTKCVFPFICKWYFSKWEVVFFWLMSQNFDKMFDLRSVSLACQQTVLAWSTGAVCHRRLAVLPLCSPSLAQLPCLGFALAACGSMQGTVGRLIQWCFVLCPLCGFKFVCHETQHSKYPTSELPWKSHIKKQMPSANSVTFAQGKCLNITQNFVMEKQWKECDVFTDIFFNYLTYLLSLPEASSQDYCAREMLMLNDKKLRRMFCVRGGSS